MGRLVKSLLELLAYLGRGASPVDGIYWTEHTQQRRVAVRKASASTQSGCTAERVVGSGYRILM
jgi:hypothetical protein